MELQEVAQQLHPLERRLLPHLKDSATVKDLVKASGLKEVEVIRALQWLENKGAVTRDKHTRKRIALGDNGKLYLKEGLPERQFLEQLGEGKRLIELKDSSSLSNEEFTIALGMLKQHNAISLENGMIKPTSLGKNLLSKGFPGEHLLRKLPAYESEVDAATLEQIKKRKDIVHVIEETEQHVQLTEFGKSLKGVKLDNALLEAVTPRLLQSEGWKGKKFRSYDVKAPVPAIYGGKRHFVQEALQFVKRIWLDLGFQEMTGSMVQLGFWNFDALFTAQDHPARDLQDTFHLKQPAAGKKLPEFANKVKAMHEHGGKTGSTGWQYKWDPKEALKNVLRPHTTCLSAQTLSKLDTSQLPAKYFSVGKVFRNETVDWSHLHEFYQTEGIVIDRNANLRHLLGYLKLFFSKMGFPKARFRPGPFPYVSPACEIEVWHPDKKTWLELGGAGIFRPEVVEPLLGEYIPVLAWGLGIERIIKDHYNIQDIRSMYQNDLQQLRAQKVWI